LRWRRAFGFKDQLEMPDTPYDNLPVFNERETRDMYPCIPESGSILGGRFMVPKGIEPLALEWGRGKSLFIGLIIRISD
jgi:hypothetical protein